MLIDAGVATPNSRHALLIGGKEGLEESVGKRNFSCDSSHSGRIIRERWIFGKRVSLAKHFFKQTY